MKQHTTIKKFLAFILLLLFAVSTVPKAYFHDLIADHKDISYCSDGHKMAPCAHRQGYNCHFDDLVIHQPFLISHRNSAVQLTVFSKPDHTPYYISSIQAFFFHTESRGPPMA